MVATTSAQLIKEIREITPNVLISFSRGKDSLASYLRIKDEFERVVPYCYEVIHGLEFIEDSLAYYENLMGQRIMRFPAPGISRMLKHRVYQPPGRSQAIDWMDMPEFTHDNLQESACKDAGLDPLKTYNALGLRAKDSAMRAMVIKKHGAVNHARRTFYPIFDYSKDDVLNTISGAGWKLPIDYRYFSASFDGLYLKFSYPIRKYFPRDWARILEVFPLLEMECLRYESAIEHGQQAPYSEVPGPHPYL
jgi:3'-phosphoadenosine 5'-phosphosulfate sulfotransferase (PAPS reductase)/FAD synthetase